MKKLFFTLGLACLFMVACNNTPKQQDQPAEQPTEQTAETTEAAPEERHCPMHDLRAEYENWDNLTDEAKAELNQKAVAIFNEMDAQRAQMEAQGEQIADQVVEMTEEQRAECESKCAEMKAKWENFATMTVDEQRALIMERLGGCQHGGDKPCCHGGEQPAETPAE